MKFFNFQKVFTSMAFSIITATGSVVNTVHAVTPGQDIAALIKLRNHDCGAGAVKNIKEKNDAQGNKTITATCPNGKRYRVVVTNAGKVKVNPL